MKEIPELKVAKLINELRFREAHLEIEKWLMEDSENIRANLNLGKLYMMEQNYEKALPIFKKILKKNENPTFLIYLAQIYSQLNLEEESDSFFLKGIKKSKGNPYYLKLYERHLLKKGRMSDAVLLYKKRVEDNKNELNSILCLGLLLEADGNIEEALYYFKKGIKIGESYLRPYLYLGGFYLREKIFEEADFYLKKAIEFNVENEILKERKSKELSTYPCIDNLFQGALIYLGKFLKLNDALKKSTIRQSKMVNDPRIFHDIISIDSPYLELSHEEALEIYLKRNKKIDKYTGEAVKFREYLQKLEDTFLRKLSKFNRNKKYELAVKTGMESMEKYGDNLLYLTILAIASYDSFNYDYLKMIHSKVDIILTNSIEEKLLKLFTLTTIAQGYSKNKKNISLELFDRIDNEFIKLEKDNRKFPALIKLFHSWNSVLKLDFHNSNELYIEYLKMDKELSLSILIFEKSGWFVMR